jgi:hypothetical protein
MKTYTILAESRMGTAFTCNCATCDAIHLEFGNIALNLKSDEFFQFKALVDSINEDYCERFFAESLWQRKLQIQLKPTLTMLAFNRQELEDMRLLLQCTAAALFEPMSLRKQVSVGMPSAQQHTANTHQFSSLGQLTASLIRSWSLN